MEVFCQQGGIVRGIQAIGPGIGLQPGLVHHLVLALVGDLFSGALHGLIPGGLGLGEAAGVVVHPGIEGSAIAQGQVARGEVFLQVGQADIQLLVRPPGEGAVGGIASFVKPVAGLLGDIAQGHAEAGLFRVQRGIGFHNGGVCGGGDGAAQGAGADIQEEAAHALGLLSPGLHFLHLLAGGGGHGLVVQVLLLAKTGAVGVFAPGLGQHVIQELQPLLRRGFPEQGILKKGGQILHAPAACGGQLFLRLIAPEDGLVGAL